MAVIDPVDKRYSFQTMHDYLYEHDFTIYPGKGAKKSTFRLAIIGDLHKKDIENFLNAMNSYISTFKLVIS